MAISGDYFIEPPWGQLSPQRLMKGHVDELAAWASGQIGAVSDIVFSAGNPVAVKKYGQTYFATQRELADQEIFALADELTPGGGSTVRSGADADFRYRVMTPDHKGYYYYRTNITAGVGGPSITLRVIPEVPPTLESYGFEPELVPHLLAEKGIVFLAGITGSGKTTAIASILHKRLTSESLNVITYESPPEFDFYKVPNRTSIITQTDIPRDLPSYSAAIRNSLRRAPDLVMLGEARDAETIDGVVTQVRTGHPVISTVHTPSVAETIDRIMAMYPKDQERAVQIALVDSMSAIVHQRLLPSTDGKRVAAREWIAFDYDLKKQLIKLQPSDLGPYLRTHIEETTDSRARSITKTIKRLRDEDRIDDLTYESVLRSEGLDPATIGGASA